MCLPEEQCCRSFFPAGTHRALSVWPNTVAKLSMDNGRNPLPICSVTFAGAAAAAPRSTSRRGVLAVRQCRDSGPARSPDLSGATFLVTGAIATNAANYNYNEKSFDPVGTLRGRKSGGSWILGYYACKDAMSVEDDGHSSREGALSLISTEV